MCEKVNVIDYESVNRDDESDNRDYKIQEDYEVPSYEELHINEETSNTKKKKSNKVLDEKTVNEASNIGDDDEMSIEEGKEIGNRTSIVKETDNEVLDKETDNEVLETDDEIFDKETDSEVFNKETDDEVFDEYEIFNQDETDNEENVSDEASNAEESDKIIDTTQAYNELVDIIYHPQFKDIIWYSLNNPSLFSQMYFGSGQTVKRNLELWHENLWKESP
ncbi:hypothetical protein C1645_833898 [Glomus cerebriforme]|uniref:Uncharacterized protein n=1 Tax=Glomus cerebriforme TaxID=658196 RepID=A0A397SF89_9GLOM|nr:hypothetical protein C1645_833898 [Glomus cerebriforme]